jgi:hypothetical protein
VKIVVTRTGNTAFSPDSENGRYIREALAAGDEKQVRYAIADATDLERSDMDTDDHIVIHDDDGTKLWEGDL